MTENCAAFEPVPSLTVTVTVFVPVVEYRMRAGPSAHELEQTALVALPATLKVSLVDPSPQLTVTDQDDSAPGSVKEPRLMWPTSPESPFAVRGRSHRRVDVLHRDRKRAGPGSAVVVSRAEGDARRCGAVQDFCSGNGFGRACSEPACRCRSSEYRE